MPAIAHMPVYIRKVTLKVPVGGYCKGVVKLVHRGYGPIS